MANEFKVKNGLITPDVEIQGSTSGTTMLIASATASGTLTVPAATDTLVGRATTDTLTNKTINGTNNTISNISLTAAVTGTLPIGNGGTGQTTQTAAFDALSPLTTKGDILVDNGTNNVRLPVGATNGHVLTVDSAEPAGIKWAAASGGGGGVSTISFGTTGLTPSTASSGAVTVAGTLAIANGGTGQTTQTAAFDALSPQTTKGDLILRNATNAVRLPVGATNGHVLTVDSNEATGVKWAAASGGGGGVSTIDFGTTGLTPSTASTGAVTVAGTLALANGGTGQTTAQAAINALVGGAGSSGQYLRSNGTNVVMSAIQVSDVPTLNQNTTGNAANVTGTVAIANGGTGQTSKTAAFDALSPLSTKGDILVDDGTNNVRLPVGTTNNHVLMVDNTTGTGIKWAAAVTNVSVVSANGFSGTVATATTTPAITLNTTVTGMLKGASNQLQAAVAGTDYVALRVSAVSSSSTWNSDNFDMYAFTSISAALTINADSGTPTNGRKILFRLLDNGTPRALTWTGGIKGFRAVGAVLPSTTTANKTTYVGAVYNEQAQAWDVIAVTTQV